MNTMEVASLCNKIGKQETKDEEEVRHFIMEWNEMQWRAASSKQLKEMVAF